ncbi:MAG: hypothetical protein AB8F74_05945 [Saprospiraceae bacterium]
MESNQIKKSIDEEKIQLTSGEKFEYWINFILILFHVGTIFILTSFMAMEDYRLLFAPLLFYSAIIILIRHKLTAPNLDKLDYRLSEKQFKNANRAAAMLNKWTVLSNTKNYFLATKSIPWQWDGIRVTVMRTEKKIYLNSMVAPSVQSNPFTFGWNKKNKKELIHQYESVIKGNDVIKKAYDQKVKTRKEIEQESKWTPKRIMKRIIGYGFSTLLTIASILIISDGDITGIFLGVITIGICGLYIYDDMNTLFRKRKS